MDRQLPSPTDLAKACEISVPFASQILNGIRNPSVRVAARIEKAFGIPVAHWDRSLPPRERAA